MNELENIGLRGEKGTMSRPSHGRDVVLLVAAGVTAFWLPAGCNSGQSAVRPPAAGQATAEQRTTDAGADVLVDHGAGIRIVVDAGHLFVDGRRLGPRSELDAGDEGLLHSLFVAAAERRGLWEDQHPGQKYVGASDVTVPADLTWTAGADLIVALVSADYRGPHTVHSAGKTVTLEFFDRPIEEPQPPKRVVELCRKSEGWSMRAAEDRNVPASKLDYSPWRPVTSATLPKLLEDECAGRCSSFSIGAESPAQPWRDLLDMIAVVRGAQAGASLPLTFTRCERPTPEQTRGRVRRAGKVQLGAMSVKGALPAEEVSRTVRHTTARFRLCYEDALDRDPKLAGSVTARVTIDDKGAVSRVVDAGSTFPDAKMVACVLGAFPRVFPQPDHGTVTVIHTLTFEPEP